jgi:hypothetical protein
MSTELWTKVKDTLQILIIPTILWSLWVSRSVEVLSIKLQQQEQQLARTRNEVDSINVRTTTTENRLVKMETTLENVQKSIDRIERLVEKLSAHSGGAQCSGGTAPYVYQPK